MEEEDPEEDPEKGLLEEEDLEKENLVEEDLEEGSVEEKSKPESTLWKRGRCGRMCRSTCLIDDPEQWMLEVCWKLGLLLLKTILFLSFLLLASVN